MEFAPSGAAALECMSHVPFDAVVTDMRMPKMSGAQLLEQVRLYYPQTIRFVLSGQSDQESILRTVSPAHQYLAKPCAIDELRQRLSQALALRDLLENPTLKELVSQIKTLPCIPALYHQLLEKLELPTCSVADVGLVMERDMAMSSKVLQLVNSAFFGLGHHISNPAQAVFMLGTETVKSLVLSIGIFSQFPAGNASQRDIDWLWNHSISTSRMSQKIAQLEKMDKQTIDDCFAAGLLHDVGELILMTQKGFQWETIKQMAEAESITVWNAEYKLLGCSHAELGAYLLGIWGLPSAIVEAVAWHHNPSASPVAQLSPLAVVHMADCIHASSDPSKIYDHGDIDSGFLARCGLRDREEQWTDACRAAFGEAQ
jgi:HD-like signal output (HDOD) protein/CheY-like chemotaxis protein